MESRHRVAQELLTQERHVELVHERGVQHARSREIRRLRSLWHLRAGRVRALHLGRPGAGVRRISRRYPPAVRSLGRTFQNLQVIFYNEKRFLRQKFARSFLPLHFIDFIDFGSYKLRLSKLFARYSCRQTSIFPVTINFLPY